MLQQLTIRDFVIVDRLELEFGQGFGALTGETGAGKSILIDALSLVLGERAEASVVRQGCEKAEVTAVFDVQHLPAVGAWLAENDMDDEEALILRRVVDRAGRSKAYLNGAPATAQQLRLLAEHLVDIHGQHAHQSLLRSETQRLLLDTQGGLLPQVQQVHQAWKVWQDCQQALIEAVTGSERLLREREQLAWQVEELKSLSLQAGEWENLQREHQLLAHAASLVEGAQSALMGLSEGDQAALEAVDKAYGRLEELVQIDPSLQEAVGLLASARVEIEEAASLLRRYGDRVEQDPARLAALERRMEAVLGCARKYRVLPDELPSLLNQSAGRLAEIVDAVDVAKLELQLEQAEQSYRLLGQQLSDRRKTVAASMGDAVTELMGQLALGRGRFEVGLVPVEGGTAFGLEQVEFRVSGLAGTETRPMAKVVSGGELSRISLAIQVVTSRSAAVPTLIFDEVDVGIGGGVAEVVGRLLKQLGQERQVLCVTHLPQVAAQADWQWQVSKSSSAGQVLSRIQVLDRDGRVSEIARMLGGVDVTPITRQHAQELLGWT